MFVHTPNDTSSVYRDLSALGMTSFNSCALRMNETLGGLQRL